MNDPLYRNPHEWPIPDDQELLRWLASNYKALNDPKHQDDQAQRLLKMTVVIVEELLHRRKAAA